MIAGIFVTALTFLALIISTASYFIHHRSKISEMLQLGRITFISASVLILLQCVWLMWGILTHQFHWQYVFSYSSQDLSTFYLISTFWGGQEGTFLLWLLLAGIYGTLIISKRLENESSVMGFMALVQSFLALILVKKNPFTYIWDINPLRFEAGIIPVDGNGLNPLLQDPWMIIHPPVLFMGYSSTTILFAFAMSALITGNYKDWIKRVFPYGIFVAFSLGTGIILGGYWAYTTLGWGGYWGWDPVENSSLIPWIASLAFLHGVLIQRKQGGLKKTNIFLALLTFILVLWGSFLTRSGVLSDFSVHSFSTSEINGYLAAMVICFGLGSIVIFLLRTRSLRAQRVSEKFFTRETFMLFGVLALILSAIFTFLGTSAPLYTDIFLDQAADVSVEYYSLLNTPVALALALLISFSPLLSWRRQKMIKEKRILLYLVLSLVLSVFAFSQGLHDVVLLLVLLFFQLAIYVNAEICISMIRKKNYAFGGYLSHAGIGLMMIGIITSSSYETSTQTTLPRGDTKQVLDYTMRYVGFRSGTDGRDEAVIEVKTAGLTDLQAKPRFYWSEFNQAYMRNPSVHNLWIKDLYISPIQVIPPVADKIGVDVQLSKDEPVYFESNILRFLGYEMPQHAGDKDTIEVFARIALKNDTLEYILKPGLRITNELREAVTACLPGTDREVYIKNINVEEASISLFIKYALKDQQEREMLAVEITEKPLINLLWLGTMIMIAGLISSLVVRSRYLPL